MIAVTVLVGLFLFESDRRLDRPLEKIILADGQMFLSAPVYVAQEKGFFRRQGIDLRIQKHATGRDALKALLDGKADFATSAETPLIEAALNGNKMQVLATLATTSTDMAIIHSRGKPFIPKDPAVPYLIGTVPDTNSEYFLELLFLYKGWDLASVQVIPLEPGEMLAALQSHQIDAAVLWEPQASLIQQQLGDGFAIRHDDGIYLWTWNLAGSPETIKMHRPAVVKILKALRAACHYIRRNPERSRRMTAAHLGIPESSLKPLWHPFKFSLTITQETLLEMEMQVRWHLSETSPGRRFNALSLFATEPLRSLDPDSVTLLRAPS